MRKFIPTSVVLCAALMVAIVVACRSDELAVRVQPRVEQRADSFSLSLDLGNVPFESRIVASQPIAGNDDSDKSDKSAPTRQTRAALVVGAGGKTTINLTLGAKKDVDVFLILRNGDGSRIAVANSTWSTVDGETTKLKTNGQYTFTWIKGSGGALVEDEMWYLDAMTGGEWDATTKAYNINKECALPRRMFNPGESVELGKDIHVPFGLGTNALGSERKWGVRMYVVNGHREAGGYSPRLVCLDPEPSFSPYGSLLCMRFRNDTHILGPTYQANQDPLVSGITWQPGYYSYLIRGIGVQSTSSTIGGWIQVDYLGQPNRTPLTWHAYKDNGHAYNFVTQYDPPFFKYSDLAVTQENDFHTGIPLKRKKDTEQEGEWTPYYYLWVKSTDETLSEPPYKSAGLSIQLNVYNATVDPAVTMKQPLVDPRVVLRSRKIHKSGRAYFMDVPIAEALSISPLSLAGASLLFQESYEGAHINTWPPGVGTGNWSYSNSEYATHRHNYNDIMAELKNTFSISPTDPSDPGATPLQNDLKWSLPTGHMIRSIFPGQMSNINFSGTIHAGSWKEESEDISVAGIKMTGLKSIYYTPWKYESSESKNEENYHTYFAIRFVGTPFCTAYRYTLYGKWIDNAPGKFPTNESRFVIHSRHLGDISEPVSGWHKFMTDQVAKGEKPTPGHPHQNDFWGDFKNPTIESGITMRVFNVPGSPSGSATGGNYIGRWLSLAVVKNGNLSNPQLQTFDVAEAGTINAYTFNNPYSSSASPAVKRFWGASVLPFLTPQGYSDPRWLDDIR